jgi:hypothetical protein
MGNGSMRNVRLADLLSDATIRKLEPVMNDMAERKLDLSAGRKKIREILEPEKAELERKGVLADYLAWVLAAAATQGGGRLGSIQVS